jgi:hypothetical protein
MVGNVVFIGAKIGTMLSKRLLQRMTPWKTKTPAF